MGQLDKIRALEKLPAKSQLGTECALDASGTTAARSVAGKLSYIAYATRPDLCYGVAAAQSRVARQQVGERVYNDINLLIEAAKD